MPRYKVFAAIDLGSTEITMKIAEVSKKNGISVLDTVKYDLSIGKESYAVGKISYNLVDKICNCFEEYLRIMKSYGVDEYVCYATTAVREASNSEYIIDQINIRTGIKVTIISNEEERFLHNKAFALNNSYFDDIIEAGAVLVDVASGSVHCNFLKTCLWVHFVYLKIFQRLKTVQPLFQVCLRILLRRVSITIKMYSTKIQTISIS